MAGVAEDAGETVIFLYTGWDTKIEDPEAYVGLDGEGVKHFPGIGREAAEFLVARRDVWGVGVDTISFDPGYDGDYRTHRVVLGAGKWALEAVANLRRLPPTGATVFVGAPKVRDATGGPVRILALVPSAPSIQAELEGRWQSAAPEPLERADGSVVYLRRDFRFEGDTWSIELTVSADAAGRSPLFMGRNSGHFSVGDYRALDGTHEVNFGFTRRRLTPLAPAVAETLNAEGCGSAPWRVGEEQDVAGEGCAAFRVPSRQHCPGEHDLARLTEGGLFLGARPRYGDLCSPERRPERPGPHALARVDP